MIVFEFWPLQVAALENLVELVSMVMEILGAVVVMVMVEIIGSSSRGHGTDTLVSNAMNLIAVSILSIGFFLSTLVTLEGRSYPGLNRSGYLLIFCYCKLGAVDTIPISALPIRPTAISG